MNGWGGRRSDFLERYVIFFPTTRGARFSYHATFKTFSRLSLQCRILLSYILVLHDFFSCLWTPPPPPLHISNGASLMSCKLQCITPTVRGDDIAQSGCDYTTCTRVGLFKGHTILSITIIKNETIHTF